MLTAFWQTEEWYAYELADGQTVGARTRLLRGATWATRVLDLSIDEAALWRGIAKTMRQTIKRGEQQWTVRVEPPESGIFDAYRQVHIDSFGKNGALPRAPRTYDVQAEWLCAGLALVGAAFDAASRPVGACFVVRWAGWAYYWSGPSLCRDVMPCLLWRLIRECRARGDSAFEIGWIGHAEDAKGKQIEWFKSRWGGTNVALAGLD